jgi:hypothetical protein
MSGEIQKETIMKCSRCGTEKSDFAEDREFVVLDVEDYKRILVLGMGWPSGVRWEIEGWKVSKAGQYRSGICSDCAKEIRPVLKRKRLKMAGIGIGFLLLSPLSITMMDQIPVIGLIGGWFVFPVAGFAALIWAYQRNKESMSFDVYHRKLWEADRGKTLHASYGMYPRQRGVQMRLVLKDWEQFSATYEEEQSESGWSHFIITIHSSLTSDRQPSKQETLEWFKARHMGEIMDRYPHKEKKAGEF